MPKPDVIEDYDPESDLYDRHIEDRQTSLQMVVNDVKWVVDYAALLAMYAAVTTVLFLLMSKAWQGGQDAKVYFGVAATAVIAAHLFMPTMNATQLLTEALAFKIRKAFGIPFHLADRHVLLKAFSTAFMSAVNVGAMWGATTLGSELLKTASLPL
jgi:hypothetical protein